MGLPNIFIRAAGCNLRCSYCDTTYAYERGTEMSIHDIFDVIKKFPCASLCITGGEPLLQKDIIQLITFLTKKRYTICIETNGSINISSFVGKPSVMISLDIKCPSSQMHDQMILNNLFCVTKKDQVKFIIKNKEDYEYAKEIIATYKPISCVFFQPVWGTNLKELSAWILQDGLPVRLGVQLQKIIWGSKKGV